MKTRVFWKTFAGILVASFVYGNFASAQKVPRKASKVDNIKIVEKRHTQGYFKVVNKPRYCRHKIVVHNPDWAPKLKYANRWKYLPAYDEHLGILRAMSVSPNKERMKIDVTPIPTGQNLSFIDAKVQQLQNDYVMITY